MKLIRFGEAGAERPGVLLDDGLCLDVSEFGSDYDEEFFTRGGMDALRRWLKTHFSSAPRVSPTIRLGPPIYRLVRSNGGHRRRACIRHIARCAIGVGRRRIGFLSSMLDHFVAVFPGATTWLRQRQHSCRHGSRAGGWNARWRTPDERIWVAPVFSSGGPG